MRTSFTQEEIRFVIWSLKGTQKKTFGEGVRGVLMSVATFIAGKINFIYGLEL